MKTNKWCVYGAVTGSIGKVVPGSITKTSVEIIHTDGQHYAPALWDIRYVKLFDDLESAVDYLVDNQGAVRPRTRERIIENLRSRYKDSI